MPNIRATNSTNGPQWNLISNEMKEPKEIQDSVVHLYMWINAQGSLESGAHEFHFQNVTKEDTYCPQRDTAWLQWDTKERQKDPDDSWFICLLQINLQSTMQSNVCGQKNLSTHYQTSNYMNWTIMQNSNTTVETRHNKVTTNKWKMVRKTQRNV